MSPQHKCVLRLIQIQTHTPSQKPRLLVSLFFLLLLQKFILDTLILFWVPHGLATIGTFFVLLLFDFLIGSIEPFKDTFAVIYVGT